MNESVESFAAEHPAALALLIGAGALAAVFGYRAWQQKKRLIKTLQNFKDASKTFFIMLGVVTGACTLRKNRKRLRQSVGAKKHSTHFVVLRTELIHNLY
ncbi:MAG: hypothetical protein ACJKTH_00255 [Patescibacteria group bacterium UBA2163]